jgi:hypothetical protein
MNWPAAGVSEFIRRNWIKLILASITLIFTLGGAYVTLRAQLADHNRVTGVIERGIQEQKNLLETHKQEAVKQTSILEELARLSKVNCINQARTKTQQKECVGL